MNVLSRRSIQIAATFLLLAGTWIGQNAKALEAPKERPILTITGKIGVSNAPNAVRLDMKMIEALPQHSFTTRTPWYNRPVKFTGPLLADVLRLVKAEGQTIGATAINDYRITIPASDASQHGVIMARLVDDQPIPVRDKGPLFIVYPFDTSAQLRSSVYYERSIWQLKALDIQ
ncbi:MAG TPA: hypothetical protein PKC60_04380 [Hydrogenophaga sp.]|uniref:hypothetical protein n=1 Tax=Hydrogenophaga sp. TaxID=1904254 RepID=UPI002BA7F2BC|nr:hypothetical protein [Hydrogenophaga sp.]HMN92448.1 hypothetical protein [Hydrogenophaga sp.]HMP11045.1 hypothetical protein [Hydrogenophaga sp.]